MIIINNINNNNNYGIVSFFDMIAHLLADHYFVVVSVVIGIIYMNTFIRIAVDTAFDVYDYYTDPLILRQRNNKKNNNICSHSNTIINNSQQCGRRRMEDKPLNSQASSIRAVQNNVNNYNNGDNTTEESEDDTCYYYLPQHHLRQTIQYSALQNMPQRNVCFVAPEKTKNHRRPPLYRNVVSKPASIGINHSDSTYSISYHSEDATTTTANGNENDANNIMIDGMTAVSPLLLNSPEVELFDLVPVFLPCIASPGVEFEMEDDDEDSTAAEHYFFSFPDNFGDSSASATIYNVDKLDDVTSLCWSYSETSEDEDDDGNVSARLIMEEFDESNSLDASTTTHVTITADDSAVLFNEGVNEDNGGSTTTAELQPVINNDDDLSQGGGWDNSTSSTTAPLLGTIWVKHPKHGCMVRRSLRLFMLSRLG